MKLYLISAEDVNGENLDLVVQANDVDRAIEFWRDLYGFERDGEDQVEDWNADTIYHIPNPLGASYENAARIWQIDANEGVEGALCWGGFTEIAPNPNYPAGRLKIIAFIPYN